MGTLRFVCPTKGCEVDTNIEVDPASFKGLYGEQLGCPECLEVHRLSKIKAWVSDRELWGRAFVRPPPWTGCNVTPCLLAVAHAAVPRTLALRCAILLRRRWDTPRRALLGR